MKKATIERWIRLRIDHTTCITLQFSDIVNDHPKYIFACFVEASPTFSTNPMLTLL